MLPPRPAAIATVDVVLVQRRDDDDGEWSDTARVPAPGCTWQPEAPSEDYGQGQRARRMVRIRARASVLAAARAQDVLEVDGALVGGTGRVRLTLVGPPAIWPHHVEVTAAWSAG